MVRFLGPFPRRKRSQRASGERKTKKGGKTNKHNRKLIRQRETAAVQPTERERKRVKLGTTSERVSRWSFGRARASGNGNNRHFSINDFWVRNQVREP